MTDIVSALNQKRASLYARKQEIKKKADLEIAKVDDEISDVDRALRIIDNALIGYLCTTCKGRGVIRIADAAGQGENCQCPACKGAGVANNA